MEVILLERIGKLGQMGDTVTVKDGFARNYLLPQGKALRATEANKERFEKERATLEARNSELKKDAEGIAGKLDGQSFIVIRQAGDTGQLYGSVSTRDIAETITEAGHQVARSQVQLDKPIKVLGIHAINISLHPEVNVSVNVNVARSEDEAARQARGEDVTAQAEEAVEEETIAVEEVFEDEALAAQAEEELQTDEAVETEAAAAEDSSHTQADEESDNTEESASDDEKEKDA